MSLCPPTPISPTWDFLPESKQGITLTATTQTEAQGDTLPEPRLAERVPTLFCHISGSQRPFTEWPPLQLREGYRDYTA